MNDDFIPDQPEAILQNPDQEQLWIESIKKRVEELLEKEPGLLFSHLYRLDIDEAIIENILKNQSSSGIAESISIEIWKRQKTRMISKKNNPQNLILDSDF
jgi:hypothetical protein